MSTYRFHWFTGKVQELRGLSYKHALVLAGYDDKDLDGIDYFEEVTGGLSHTFTFIYHRGAYLNGRVAPEAQVRRRWAWFRCAAKTVGERTRIAQP